ncbi:MAG: hypothetical protein PHP32_00975, partial [Candidatus Izemoplasmatales bacterium]|nr:hypothetical protein [Candidatus Izemoplasmatales bacterium]
MNIPDPQAYTPMMQQYLEIKKDYTDFIVFFRLGDFYEMFFTDALVASKELEIVLTGRDAGAPERVPMCGVPHHAAQVYAQKLIDRGYKIAIVEQVEDPQLAKGLVRREVIKIMTPGTLMEEGSVDARTNNYIVALEETKSSWILAYCDLTTGEVSLLSIPHQEELLESEIANLNAKEVVLSSHAPKHLFRNYLELNELTLSTQDETSIPVSYRSLVSDIYDKDLLTAFGRLVGYLEKTQKRELMHLQKAIVFESRSYLQIDHHSIRNLELIETYRSQSKKGTLLWLMDDCQTAMGSRYLKQTILRPLTDVTKIALRHAFVASMNDHFLIHEELKTHLKEVYDLERIIGRLSFGNANAKDLVHLAKSLSVVPEIRSMMRSLEDPYASS